MRSCIVCGKPIPEDRTSNNTKYCSVKCSRQANAQQSIQTISRRANAHNKLAPYIYTAYNSKCAICDWKALEGTITPSGKYQPARGNEIHHITPIAEGGKDTADNLILLCPNHHKQADLGLIDRATLREYTKPFILTAEEKDRAKADCADAIASLIFDT